VKLGVETPEQYEITYGLEEGETVIVGNQSQLHPGQRVRPQPMNPNPKFKEPTAGSEALGPDHAPAEGDAEP